MFKNTAFLPTRTLIFGLVFALFASTSLWAQDVPDIPGSVEFAGINVRFDDSARKIIESDVRSLMSNKRFWELKMDRAVLYFPILESVLIEEEVPLDFKYLAAQESSLTPDAVSTSDAVGFWQFKQETAQELGLQIDDTMDERKSITASTRAAARYLKRSNEQFHNWVSSLYSYYLGMGGISKLVPQSWAYAKEVTLDARTDRYVLRFFAHKIAMEAGLERYRTTNTVVLLEYPNGRGRTFEMIGRDMGIDPLEIRRYNLWTQSGQIPADREYMVVLPVSADQINVVREKLSLTRQEPVITTVSGDIGFPVLRQASVQLRGRNDPVFYDVNGLPGIEARAGDQASTLAKIAKISTSRFLKYNDMDSRDPLEAGEVYYLAKKNKKGIVPFHNVREGETIHKISQVYGIRAKDLMKYNRIMNRNLRLQTGRVMWLMKKRPANKPVEIVNPSTPIPGSYAKPELVGGTEEIPKNASERRRYKPKLADSTPETTSNSNPTSTPPASETMQPDAKTPTSSSTGVGTGNDRIVIISADDKFAPGDFDSEPAPKPRTSTPTSTFENTPSRTSTAPTATTTPAPPARTPSTPAKEGVKYHTVEAGQTYYRISKMYGITINDVMAWNGLLGNSILEVGQQLAVSDPNKAVRPAAQRPATTNGYTLHTVAAGETLFRISKDYDVSIQAIQTLNNMTDTNVKLGSTLKIPKK